MRQLMSTQKKKVDKKNNGDIYPLNIHNWKKSKISSIFFHLICDWKKVD